ncbi:hypothetical protein KZZ08_16500 [Roseovarius mucosus]|uniref:Uncharacterized protein n=1 Tax=Roseovarius mucosus TaxID=215743 RepID=A0A1V0RU88_9RHOB|nr:hypothetical protein [Roseovarius mucosus]ARE85334.1 hypothetical protein ROSMUCSMR3_03887 [Roseovarius mucosus]MBW4975233.1 hypothetical protein [Roseovarius mucosus]
MTDLDSAMIRAHATGDRAALISLYTQAADRANTLDAACFFLTHAYIFALEAGALEATPLHARLVAHGREA